MKMGKRIIRNRRLFNSQAEADSCSSVKRNRKHPTSYTMITINGVGLTEKNKTPNPKSRRLRRAVRRLAFDKTDIE